MNTVRKLLDYASLSSPDGEPMESLLGPRDSIRIIAMNAGLTRAETAELILANTNPGTGLVWIADLDAPRFRNLNGAQAWAHEGLDESEWPEE